MFHIDLGQNDGPFKSSVEARNSEKPSSKAGPALGQEPIEFSENYDTIYSMMQRISEYSTKALKDLNECKEREASLREEIVKDIHEVVEKENASVLEILQPTIQRNYKALKQTLKKEKEENEQLLKQLLTIRKECATMNLQITACDSKISQIHRGLLGEAANAEKPEETDLTKGV